MTETISEILENTLFDLSDTLKLHLIELNENRSLFMNGPSEGSFNEHLISVLPRTKQAIETLDREIKTTTDENDLIANLKRYSQDIEQQLLNVIELHTTTYEPEENLRLAQSLDTYYHCKGQHDIISELLLQINKYSI